MLFRPLVIVNFARCLVHAVVRSYLMKWNTLYYHWLLSLCFNPASKNDNGESRHGRYARHVNTGSFAVIGYYYMGYFTYRITTADISSFYSLVCNTHYG